MHVRLNVYLFELAWNTFFREDQCSINLTLHPQQKGIIGKRVELDIVLEKVSDCEEGLDEMFRRVTG